MSKRAPGTTTVHQPETLLPHPSPFRSKPFAEPIGILLAFAAGLFLASLSGCGTSAQAMIERGNKLYDSGKYNDAAIEYQKALQKSPKLGDASYRLGLTELRRNNPVQAYRAMQHAADLMPDNTEVAASLGQLAMSLYNADPQHPKQLYDQAGKSAGKLLTANKPDFFTGNLLKGAISLVDRKPAEAIDFLHKAIEAKPADMGAQLGLARALVENNQAAAGMDTAQEILRKDKTFGPAYDFLFAQYQSAGKTADAESILRVKVSNNPTQAAYILELARYYAASQKAPEVTATIQKLLDNPTVFPDGRLQAGDFYVSVGRPNEAMENYQAGLKANPKNAALLQKRMFRVLGAQRKWPEAQAQLTAVLKDKPDDSEAKLARALAWLDEGKPENLDPAIAELQAQSTKNPQDATLHFQLGGALARKGDQDGALKEWTAAAKQNRSYLPPRYALVQLDLSKGNAQGALQVAEEIIAMAPRDPQARLAHATALTAAGQYQRARTELTKLAAENPKAPQIKFRLGVLDISEKKFAEAAAVFRDLETTSAGDPQVLAGLAQALQGQNESGKAIQMLQDELKRRPNSPQLRQILAQLAMTGGKFDLAIDQYKQMAAAAPTVPAIQGALAGAYIASGDANTGIGILEKLVQADPKSVQATLELAHALVSANRMADAKVRYRRVLELQPGNANALNDLAFLMADSGENLDQALSYAQKGLQAAADPGLKASATDTLGWIYLKKNMNDAAIQTLQPLARSNPDNPSFRYHLGTAFFQKGDKPKARNELEAALAAKPASADETGIRQLLARL